MVWGTMRSKMSLSMWGFWQILISLVDTAWSRPFAASYKSCSCTKNCASSPLTWLVVSLSGGVDSMVIARILVHLRDTLLSSQSQNGGQRVPPRNRVGRRKGDKRAGALVPLGMFASLTVVAIHINYGNRAESGREASFLRQWCSSFGIDFHERRIDEVSRGKTPRDIYERRSREIRFAFYREVLAKYTMTPMRCPGIFLATTKAMCRRMSFPISFHGGPRLWIFQGWPQQVL